jgi:Circadian oscillating protein COP23
MKLPYLFISASIALTTLGISIQPGFSQTEKGANSPNQMTFFCHQLYDPASGEKAPMTVVWIPERQGHVRIIGWKSEAFGKNWTPQKRCDEVSPKFQKFYESGQLNYLSAGRIETTTKNGNISAKQVICGVQDTQSVCNDKNLLFTVKDTEEAGHVLQSLVDVLVGTSTEPIWQSSDQRLYLNVKNYLREAPIVNIAR